MMTCFAVLLVFFRVCPIFQVSNVTGENLDLLKMFLNLLSSGGNFNEDDPAEFQVDETYSVPVSCGNFGPLSRQKNLRIFF